MAKEIRTLQEKRKKYFLLHILISLAMVANGIFGSETEKVHFD